MERTEAERLIAEVVKTALPCPFCGKVPKIEARCDDAHSAHGSWGHFAIRKGCCEATGLGQTELFFCNNHELPNFELWQWMACNLVKTWNTRDNSRDGAAREEG